MELNGKTYAGGSAKIHQRGGTGQPTGHGGAQTSRWAAYRQRRGDRSRRRDQTKRRNARGDLGAAQRTLRNVEQPGGQPRAGSERRALDNQGSS